MTTISDEALEVAAEAICTSQETMVKDGVYPVYTSLPFENGLLAAKAAIEALLATGEVQLVEKPPKRVKTSIGYRYG